MRTAPHLKMTGLKWLLRKDSRCKKHWETCSHRSSPVWPTESFITPVLLISGCNKHGIICGECRQIQYTKCLKWDDYWFLFFFLFECGDVTMGFTQYNFSSFKQECRITNKCYSWLVTNILFILNRSPTLYPMCFKHGGWTVGVQLKCKYLF